MEANRWYMCKHDYGLGTDIIFKKGKIYFFEPQGNAIATIDEVGDSYYFSDNYRGTFIYLFTLATNEEIHNPNQVVFKEKANVESQVLTKREQIAAMIQISHKERLMNWDQIIMENKFPVGDEKLQLAWFVEAEAKYKAMKADALIKALES